MKMNKLLPALIVAFITLFSAMETSVYGAEKDRGLTTARLYGVYWQNVHIGDIVGELRTSGNRSELRVSMRALNILKTLTRYENDSFVVAHATMPYGFIPESFDVHSVLRKKSKTAHIEYSNAGEIIHESVSHPANPLKVKPIDAAMKNGSVDPLTAALIARENVRHYLNKKGKNYFTLSVYEGRYLYRLHFTVNDPVTITVQGHAESVVPLHFSRTPLGGFSKEELSRMQKQDPVIDVYLSNDALLLPVQAEGKAMIGKANAVIKKECAIFSECAGED